jgi:hypothetical protein
MFMPFALAPAILVWFKPTTGKFTIWAACSAFASVIYLAAGSPYADERELVGMRVISTAMYAAIFVSVVGATIAAWTLAARARRVRFHKFVHFYLMRHVSGDVSGHDDEVNEARWVALEDSVGMLAFKGERKALEQAREMLAAGAGG